MIRLLGHSSALGFRATPLTVKLPPERSLRQLQLWRGCAGRAAALGIAEQSFDSIRKYTLEETYEVLDAIERRDWANLTEELGDLLLQVLFYAQMAADEGRFTIADVLDTLNRKLIRRHPHVFGEEASAAAGNQASVDAEVSGSAAKVLANWEEIKISRKAKLRLGAGRRSLLDAVQRSQPALSEAAKLGSKAARLGLTGATGAICWPRLKKRRRSWLRRRMHERPRKSGAGNDKQEKQVQEQGPQQDSLRE